MQLIYFLATTVTAPFRFKSEVIIEGDFIKIGSSHEPETRLQYLRNQHQRKDLTLLGVMAGGVLSEKKLHQKFRHLRVTYRLIRKGSGPHGSPQRVEWFYRSDEILEFIAVNVTQDMSIGDRSQIGRPPLGIVAPDSLLMLVEFAAQRAGVSVDQYIEASLRLKLEKDGLSTHPFL